jgi:hypothetical protein
VLHVRAHVVISGSAICDLRRVILQARGVRAACMAAANEREQAVCSPVGPVGDCDCRVVRVGQADCR